MKDKFRGLPEASKPFDYHTADYGDKMVDVYKLIKMAESLPIEEVKMETLNYFKTNNYWKDKNGNQISPAQIINEAAKSSGVPDWEQIVNEHPEWEKEITKVQNADYNNFPIILVDNEIMDGAHRLTKAFIDKLASIKAKRFPKLPLETLINQDIKL